MKQLVVIFIVVVCGEVLVWGEEARSEIALFFTGFVQGSFEPCGCKAGPTGGLARRAGYVESYSKKGVYPIHLDLGNYFQMIGPYSKVVNRLMLESLERFPIRVLNLGAEDLFHWPMIVDAALTQTNIVSTNLVPMDTDEPAPAPYAIVEVPAQPLGLSQPIRIGFLGLTEPSRIKPRAGFRALEPLDSVARVLPHVSRLTDLVVVLADLSLEEARAVAREFASICAILLADRNFQINPPEKVENSIILSGVDRGRYLGRLSLKFDKAGKFVGRESDFIELGDSIPEDSDWLNRQDSVARTLYGLTN